MKHRFAVLFALSSFAVVGGCAMKGPPNVAARGSAAVSDTVSQTTAGVGGAVQAPQREMHRVVDYQRLGVLCLRHAVLVGEAGEMPTPPDSVSGTSGCAFEYLNTT